MYVLVAYQRLNAFEYFTVENVQRRQKMAMQPCLNSYWFDLILYVPVNRYGHVGTVSSPNNTYFVGKLD